ncbi:hypothetical protein BpHYR1_037376 [Brachionus plicatilis]|uniref:Uncharacterized protein n=1 Tax=Brachionus plicatilis TaxID=10195 RepID=A0A3M7S5F3_BRAPC|nr:hypothetical protein BpHYR1_037376 [Brachionus plicatilis]
MSHSHEIDISLIVAWSKKIVKKKGYKLFSYSKINLSVKCCLVLFYGFFLGRPLFLGAKFEDVVGCTIV